jgi:transcriptional regulator with XRE-family HTH domain
MEKEGITQSELSRRTGLGVTLINKYRNLESSGISGVSAETVQVMRDKLGIDPRLFFDPYEGKRPYALYLMDAKREAAQVAELNQRIVELNQRLLSSEQANVDLRNQLERRLAALEGLAGQPAPVDRSRKARRTTR